MTRFMLVVASLLLTFICSQAAAADASPHPAKNPESPLMLAGPWLPEEPHRLDFANLPRVPSEHAVVSDARARGESIADVPASKSRGGVNQHNYLTHFAGRFWIMWSDGPGVEDRVGQRVKFATSPDGLAWGKPEYLTPVPPGSGPDSPHYNTRTEEGFRWISRGFWQRDGELLALCSLDEAAGFFGESLELRAFRWNETEKRWDDAGLVYKNAINNFPPLKLRTGNWMMSRRKFDYKTSGAEFLVGGVRRLDDWESFPVLGSASELKAEEPDWWILPDNSLCAVFRDNRRSGYIYRSFSTDDGRTWSKPIRTNFPDATSKMSGLRLSDGRYVLVSNSNPQQRDPLTIAVSRDGLVFDKLVYLIGGRHIDYPHVYEHDDHLYVAFSGRKQTVEVLKVRLADLDAVKMPAAPLVDANAKVKKPKKAK
ncbi:MAG: exo-alpha-sialidase [Pirellulales bacterium]